MNISSSISQIAIPEASGKTAKIYLWPKYNNGSVDKIEALDRKVQDKPVYTKASDEERDRIINSYNESKNRTGYLSTGEFYTRMAVKPGILFDALA